MVDKNIETTSHTVEMINPSLLLETDASDIGWGAVMSNQKTRGSWSIEEKNLHINAKELLAVFFAIQIFLKSCSDITVKIMVDNTTAVCYINNQGGGEILIL